MKSASVRQGSDRIDGGAGADVGGSERTSRRDMAQVGGVIGAPVLLLLALSAKYAVVQTLGCHDPRASLYVHVIAVISLLGCAVAALTAQRAREPRHSSDLPKIAAAHANGEAAVTGDMMDAIRTRAREVNERRARNQAMHVTGVVMSGLCALVIIAQWLPQFALRPCTF